MTRFLIALTLITLTSTLSQASADNRELVKMPTMMQQHMKANMRDHLLAISEILAALGAGEMDQAADIAESRLGMSSLDDHGASHMARVMPQGMRETGTRMHQAASRFARTAQEGDALAAYRELTEVTANCVSCHASYRIR